MREKGREERRTKKNLRSIFAFFVRSNCEADNSYAKATESIDLFRFFFCAVRRINYFAKLTISWHMLSSWSRFFFIISAIFFFFFVWRAHDSVCRWKIANEFFRYLQMINWCFFFSPCRIGVNIAVALMLGVLYIGAGNEGSRVLDNYNLLFAILMHSSMATMMLTVLTCKLNIFCECLMHPNGIWFSILILIDFLNFQLYENSSNWNGNPTEGALQPMVLTQGILYVCHITGSADNGEYIFMIQMITISKWKILFSVSDFLFLPIFAHNLCDYQPAIRIVPIQYVLCDQCIGNDCWSEHRSYGRCMVRRCGK